jgi:hypothetical protein
MKILLEWIDGIPKKHHLPTFNPLPTTPTVNLQCIEGVLMLTATGLKWATVTSEAVVLEVPQIHAIVPVWMVDLVLKLDLRLKNLPGGAVLRTKMEKEAIGGQEKPLQSRDTTGLTAFLVALVDLLKALVPPGVVLLVVVNVVVGYRNGQRKKLPRGE